MPEKALIVIDCQNDYFPGGACPLEGQVDAGKNIARLLDGIRSNEENVIHLQHMYKDKTEPYLIEGTPGTPCVRDVVRCSIFLYFKVGGIGR